MLRKDDGRAFFDYLKEKVTRGRPAHFEFHGDSKWFVTFRYDLVLAELGGARLLAGDPASPGPFRGEVDYLLLDIDDIEDHVWDSQSEYRRYVSELAGIRVYRDGFGIRVGEDWLDLGRQATRGASLYGLRPKNVIGFVAISARDNRVLLETTSREGFQKTPHYQNFYKLLQKFVGWTSLAQAYLRRGALDFLKHSRAQDAGLELGGDNTSVAEKLREHAASIDRRDRELAQARDSMAQSATTAQDGVKEITAGDDQFSLYHQDKLNELNEVVAELGSSIDQTRRVLDENQPESNTTAKAQQILDVILEREGRLQQELAMLYEGVALGLTAEALSHEIAGIAERLAEMSSALGKYLSKQKSKDTKVLGFVEHVKSSVAALRKQLAHLAPSLRYVRERREILRVAHELEETREFYEGRFSSHAITMLVRAMAECDVKINRGKLSQIFDNILLNSEYWLREARRKDPSFTGEIAAEVARPFLRIWDNGPGVALSVEDELFDAFVTNKEKGKGRGLGLFIVQQLLDAEGCSICLLPERNEAGRRFKFEIEFRGALNE